MANEFITMWENQNAPDYLINAANLSKISPHLLYQGKQFIFPVEGAKNKLRIAANTGIKIIIGGEHKIFVINNDIEFVPVNILDAGSVLEPGTDYHIYAVAASDNASLVVSKNASYPAGATASNSRRIGGFHTLCADIGALQNTTHSLYDFSARDILPQGVHDLLNRPRTCDPQGMVLDPATGIWVDIYMQSSTGATTKSAYQGTVTKSRSFDGHQEDLAAVGKRMLLDAEFTSATMGTVPYRAVMGAVDPVTTGGKVNTAGQRIVSNIGCEDMAGCYWQWIGIQSFASYSTTAAWAEASPAGQGQQYLPSNALVAGGGWTNASRSGARCRDASYSRAILGAYYSSRGCAEGLAVV